MGGGRTRLPTWLTTTRRPAEPKVCGLSGGGDWIRTSSTRARWSWLSRPLTRPVTWDGSTAAGATRPPRSALPRADTNRGFRVGRSIFDATRHAGVFVVPVAPANAMGSPPVVTGPFSAVNRGPLFRRLIPSAGAARHHPICPGPTPDPKSIAKPIDGIGKGSAKSWGWWQSLLGSAKIVSNRLEDGSSLNCLSIGGRYSQVLGQFSLPGNYVVSDRRRGSDVEIFGMRHTRRRWPMPRSIARAQRTASTTLGNATSTRRQSSLRFGL